MITSEGIKNRLWNGANELRGSMDASRYKDYMLGLMFYKFLSDKTLETFRMTSGLKSLTEAELVEEYRKTKELLGDQLENMIKQILGYYVSPEYLYQSWIQDINNGTFEVQKVIDSLNNFERTIAAGDNADDFKGIFSNSTLDLTDTALGSNLNERSKNIKALIGLFSDLDMIALQKGDVLGDAYEYLIGQFAMESGKKAGEFYTPRQVSEVMAQIVAKTSQIRSIYDPTVGSGSLLLTVKKHLDKDSQENLSYYGQEKNTATYNLSRMNLLLHDVLPGKMTIKNGDTLAEDWPEDPEHPDEGIQFDAVVMNPPYSLKGWNRSGVKVSDPRFQMAGVLPPDNKGDFAFLLHGLYHLGPKGTMAIVLPHGVLFRGAAEGEIREKLLEKNYIDTIIGLPANLFTNTGIPVIIMILKKNRELGSAVLMIDASKNFVKEGKQNKLQEKDIARIVDTYLDRKEESGYSHLASREEIIENQYNLNIPRYVSSIEEGIPHDVEAHLMGGIPERDIAHLEVMKKIVPDLLKESCQMLRPGYVELTRSIDDMAKALWDSSVVQKQSKALGQAVDAYITKYWEILKNVSSEDNLVTLRDKMLWDIKSILSNYEDLDCYEGYQIIAEIWRDLLDHDLEIIASSDFYEAGRSREPFMVTKGSGSKKHEEQEGWQGSIVPNSLIEKNYYTSELDAITEKRNRIAEIEGELSDLAEAAKEEGRIEASALADTLNETGDAIENKLVKTELKIADKASEEYKVLKKTAGLFSEKSALNKECKVDEQNLKEAIWERILHLTDEEINQLMYEKWFGTVQTRIVDLIRIPLQKELDLLKVLKERYADTIDSIDAEIADMEKELQDMMQELVVI